jgi:diamine N-acetyltransferase
MINEEQYIITLAAEEGATLSSGSLRLYAIPSAPANSSLITHHSSLPPVGAIDLYNYDPLNHRAAVGIMVSKEYRRQGYALAMLRELEHSSFITHHSTLHTLFADIAATNTASIALFKKAGYEQCGHFKEWLAVNDHYVDSIRMQKIL